MNRNIGIHGIYSYGSPLGDSFRKFIGCARHALSLYRSTEGRLTARSQPQARDATEEAEEGEERRQEE